MASTPRKFSEKIALLNQKEAEGNAAFEIIMNQVKSIRPNTSGSQLDMLENANESGCNVTKLEESMNLNEHINITYESPQKLTHKHKKQDEHRKQEQQVNSFLQLPNQTDLVRRALSDSSLNQTVANTSNQNFVSNNMTYNYQQQQQVFSNQFNQQMYQQQNYNGFQYSNEFSSNNVNSSNKNFNLPITNNYEKNSSNQMVSSNSSNGSSLSNNLTQLQPKFFPKNKVVKMESRKAVLQDIPECAQLKPKLKKEAKELAMPVSRNCVNTDGDIEFSVKEHDIVIKPDCFCPDCSYCSCSSFMDSAICQHLISCCFFEKEPIYPQQQLTSPTSPNQLNYTDFNFQQVHQVPYVQHQQQQQQQSKPDPNLLNPNIGNPTGGSLPDLTAFQFQNNQFHQNVQIQDYNQRQKNNYDLQLLQPNIHQHNHIGPVKPLHNGSVSPTRGMLRYSPTNSMNGTRRPSPSRHLPPGINTQSTPTSPLHPQTLPVLEFTINSQQVNTYNNVYRNVTTTNGESLPPSPQSQQSTFNSPQGSPGPLSISPQDINPFSSTNNYDIMQKKFGSINLDSSNNGLNFNQLMFNQDALMAQKDNKMEDLGANQNGSRNGSLSSSGSGNNLMNGTSMFDDLQNLSYQQLKQTQPSNQINKNHKSSIPNIILTYPSDSIEEKILSQDINFDVEVSQLDLDCLSESVTIDDSNTINFNESTLFQNT